MTAAGSSRSRSWGSAATPLARAARRSATSSVNELTRLQSAVDDGKVRDCAGGTRRAAPGHDVHPGSVGLATVGSARPTQIWRCRSSTSRWPVPASSEDDRCVRGWRPVSVPCATLDVELIRHVAGISRHTHPGRKPVTASRPSAACVRPSAAATHPQLRPAPPSRVLPGPPSRRAVAHGPDKGLDLCARLGVYLHVIVDCCTRRCCSLLRYSGLSRAKAVRGSTSRLVPSAYGPSAAGSPRSVEASPMRSGDARDTTEVRPGVP